jgi:putative ABC transport system permease protein
MSMQLTLPNARYPKEEMLTRFYTTLLDRLREQPRVTGAGVASGLPPAWNDTRNRFTLEGQPRPDRTDNGPRERATVVSDGYFAAMGMTLLRGRDFTIRDDADAPPVLIVSESFARRYWPGAEPLGKRIRFMGNDTTLVEVVGVVRDARHNPNVSITPIAPTMYVPVATRAWSTMSLVVRSDADEKETVAMVQRELAKLDPGLAPGDVLPLPYLVKASLSPQRLTAAMLGVFAALAMLLAVIGIYGVMAYLVTQRTSEIGIRIALGAQRRDVIREVMRHAGLLVGLGLAIGIGGALAMAKAMRTLLHDTSATDPLTFGLVSAALALVALAGSFIPARRAAAVDPMVALRSE